MEYVTKFLCLKMDHRKIIIFTISYQLLNSEINWLCLVISFFSTPCFFITSKLWQSHPSFSLHPADNDLSLYRSIVNFFLKSSPILLTFSADSSILFRAILIILIFFTNKHLFFLILVRFGIYLHFWFRFSL